MRIALGSDRLLESTLLEDRCVGLVSNPASVDRRLQHTADRLASREDLTLAALFGPQHGFDADLQDNMVQTGHAHDHRWRVPIYSLYSETREPTAEMLAGLDVLVVDLQNVGARIYTFIYTMANCLRAAKRHGVPVIVCDRPNPIGGVDVEGPVLDPGFESFVGQFPIPMRHGMTIGELARLFNEHFGIGAKLTVVAMAGWQRDMYWDDTGLPWVMPSPNMPTLDTAIVYPGMVLFEGTNLSEGRGTTRPFEISGAPWIDARTLAEQMNDAAIPGAWFRPVGFEPPFQKHARQACGGCQIHVTDRHVFKPVLTGVALLAEARRLDPERFAWRQPPYEYEEAKWPIDILAGSDELRLQIEADVPALEVAASWEDDVRAFREVRERFLLY
jgi:uncharacterized protein YbbC (DUF1343 family)